MALNLAASRSGTFLALLLVSVAFSNAAHGQIPDKTVIVIRDYRVLSRDDFSKLAQSANPDATSEEIAQQYARHLATVRQVQREQYSVARRAMLEHGTNRVFVEAVPEERLETFVDEVKAWAEKASEVDKLRTQAVELRDELNERRQSGDTAGDYESKLRELQELQGQVVEFGMQELRLGVVARLMASELLDLEIGALDTNESLQLAVSSTQQADDGGAIEDSDKLAENRAAREKLLAKKVADWLKDHDTAILILGGETDLRNEFQELELQVQYGVATVPSFPD